MAATAASGGGKAAKTVGNAAVASNSPSDSSTAARSGGGDAKIIMDSLVGGVIQETLRYRTDIRPMAVVDTLAQASDLSESDQPEISFRF